MGNRKKLRVPSWMGNFPFPPEGKRPVVITSEMEAGAVYVYGEHPHQITVQKYVSSDKINVGHFTLGPGKSFEPAGIHPGPELYYVLAGEVTVFNPETGETYVVRAGEAFLVTRDTWHQGYNFGQEEAMILTVAPVLYSVEQKTDEAVFAARPRFFYRGEQTVTWPSAYPPFDRKGMSHLPPDRWLNLVLGGSSHCLVSMFASSADLEAGLMTLPAGARTAPESHTGDEVVCVLSGDLLVRARNEEGAEVCLSLGPGEKAFIPSGYEHDYHNHHTGQIKALYAIAPNQGN